MPTPSSPLDYAPPPPLLRRRFRSGVLIVLVFSVALAAVRWGPEGWRRGRVAYWQRQCLNYGAPSDQVVYDQDPATAPVLAARGGGYAALAARGTPVAVYEPPCLAALRRAAPALRSAPARSVLFLHERQTPSGVRRLVVVEGGDFARMNKPLFINGVDVETYAWEPGAWGADPKDRTVDAIIDVEAPAVSATPRLRVFAGRPDPADPTHLTIRYELEGRSHTVDGWLRDNGEVEFKASEPAN